MRSDGWLLRASNRDVPEAAPPLVARFQTLVDRDDRPGGKRALEDALARAPGTVSIMMALAQLEEQMGR